MRVKIGDGSMGRGNVAHVGTIHQPFKWTHFPFIFLFFFFEIHNQFSLCHRIRMNFEKQ